ncbi:MAG: hypothetical protein VXZ35_11500 [Pseudomonadota bacterium]|nr:hypothetical protein [Pseudomonadota bacterium]
MNVCFNSLELTVLPAVADKILAKGFENCDYDDWGFSPQGFSFEPFLSAEDKNDDQTKSALGSVWTNWINRENAAESEEHALVIEFESENVPPISVVNGLIEWMKRERLVFDLNYRYRLENENWHGALQANS